MKNAIPKLRYFDIVLNPDVCLAIIYAPLDASGLKNDVQIEPKILVPMLTIDPNNEEPETYIYHDNINNKYINTNDKNSFELL